MSARTLPSPRTILSDLLSQLQRMPAQDDTSSNPLKSASEDTKKILLTLHVVYPNEFLPALDLLDRRLLTRFSLKDLETLETTNHAQPPADPPASRTTPLYIVHSAQQSRSTSTGRYYDPLATHYEVRTLAWNCSCPAFAFAAFPSSHSQNAGNFSPSGEFFTFGGLTRGNGMPPVCKHLLACVLAEHCPMFRPFAEEKEVSAEEIAGWCAGWGD